MGLKSSVQIAWRSLSRRKTKNLSAILAITLGVTLLVGIQIATETLQNAFLTTLLQTQGEVDVTVVNGTGGTYLKATDMATINSLVPDAVGVMPELSTNIPAVVDSQFNPKMAGAGIPFNYSTSFGTFYDWKTETRLELDTLLTENTSLLLSSDQAEKFGLTRDTQLPINLTTEFTNVTAHETQPIVPLSKWTVNENLTTAGYSINSTESNLYLEVQPVQFMGVAIAYTIETPRLNLANYTRINVTATGTDNAKVLLGFSTLDGIAVDFANWTDTATLNNQEFNITEYSDKQLRGDVYLGIISINGMPASVNITEIAFETPTETGTIRTPLISYTSEQTKIDLRIVAFYDSNRPGIGSRYPGAVFKIEHLQEWLSLQDSERKTDIISRYLVAYKTDHFTKEIDKSELNIKIEDLKAIIPEQTNTETGKTEKIYRVASLRLDFVNVADFFISLLSTILNTLGFLVMLTGILLITNVQLMSVEDREFQTGVMRAVGDNRRGIFQSIIIENLFQGIVGGLLGYIGGIGFGQLVAAYLIGLFGTGEFSVKPVISLSIVLLSLLVGVLIAIITGILPALRASRVNIVEALRGIKTSFKAKSSRNLVAIGILLTMAGTFLLFYNGIIDDATQAIWTAQGWNSLEEWRIIIMGFGLLAGGIGIVSSKFISRVKAFNITAIALYVIPTFLFIVAMDTWITGITGIPLEILTFGMAEILIGSVLLVALNLPSLMRILRNVIIRIKGLKGVGQISPALISSHTTRSTLTFAIFTIILTLNVVVATLIPTNLGTVNQYEQESRGIDIAVFLNEPEAIINDTSFSNELYKTDNSITDVIGFKTFNPNMDFTKFTALKDPFSDEFEAGKDMLPVVIAEFTADQIRGNASSASDTNWRYDFYLSSYPDGVRQNYNPDMTDHEVLELSKKAWDQFLDPTYKMAAYNVSSIVTSVISGNTSLNDVQTRMSNEDPLKDKNPLTYENGTTIENPIVFTDSFLLPAGMQIWLPMNTSDSGTPTFQVFTIGGRLDSQRGGGFPLGTSTDYMSGDIDIATFLGTVYMPEYWANQTNYLAKANGETSTSREPNQYDTYLVKTTLAMDDPELDNIARKIENFTNTNDQGYRLLAKDVFIFASAEPIYTRIVTTLRMTDRISSFLQIYVSFGLAIGAVGMGVISVRNVAERKREIGMMRAIGFPRRQVIISVLLELVVLGIIGLALGVINGLIISAGFANLQDTTLIIPWDQLGVYLGFIVLIALGAGSVPAYVASRIPPAEALRYVG